MKKSLTFSFHGFSSLILIGVVSGVIILLGFLFYKKLIPFSLNTQKISTSVKEENHTNNGITFSPINDVDFQSIPVTREGGKLSLIPLYGNEQIVTQISVGGFSGAADYGTTESQPAPDFKKIAFIEDGVLGLISADGNQVTRLPKELKVEYISGWSPDSKKLLIYATRSSLEDMFLGYGDGGPNQTQYDSNKYPGGFYLLDMERGTVKFIELLDRFVSWIGNDQILSLVSFPRDGQAPEEHYIVFNLDSYKADPKTLEGKLEPYFGRQFSFSSDGKKWALGLGNTGNIGSDESFSKVVVSDFPNIDGTVIDQGSWAEVQGPVISPNGQRVAYVNHSGGSSWETRLWDGREKKQLTSGRPYMWINDNQFLMKRFEYNQETSESITKVFLYDIPSGAERQLY